ncbi:peptide chain release factor N(5)-glutamine methyltransferase [Wolbachia endosymbiont of Chironomus riparius]|uniref:peptide chain release factor N(5)-glutamine methyltransferase n=1 Tax=Wolbachia endosymbiont of Chironomus riparius TaxID=2883238 RepID=UPI00209CE0A3|nr:peptide chain release factor N(5)-glutamine methyltransferase [Wolbachia endosymbiont of Chironomus riparius]
MKTINSLIQEGAKFLSLYSIDTAYLDCEIIMQHVLNVERSFIVINNTNLVPIYKENLFWQLINKRSEKHPISHIIGKREFWSNDFIVSQDVLDPRPDSETLVSTVLKYYKNKKQKLKIADLGTGTGCLLISVLNEYKYAIGIGFEKSFKAYRIACKNIKKHNLFGRAKIFPNSWTKCEEKFDLVISNPPYIRRTTLKNLQIEVKKEPRIALDGGTSGLYCYLSIFSVLKKYLRKNGIAILEIGQDQNNINKLVNSYGLIFKEYVYDLSGMKRCIVIKQMYD